MAEYCLRWNNHQPNLVTVFSELLTAESLVDVTLATDGHFIHAHKLVLSACSVYFKDLFRSNPCKHPIVFLKDIRIEDLKTVIDFIYRGEVNVSQDRLQDVLKTAESLRIKGLADKPFSYDEYPSQRSGQHHSSSFSSQRSSLTDSRDQVPSVDTDDIPDIAGNSPPATKKRKVTATSQDSSESTHDANHEGEKQPKDDTQKKSNSVAINEEGTLESASFSTKEKVKEENESFAKQTDSQPEFKESGAADAMLLLQRSSSEAGGEEGSTITNPTINTRGELPTSLISSHSQGRGKRGVLQRQPGIFREGAVEEAAATPSPAAEDANYSPEYIVPDSITLTFTTETPAVESLVHGGITSTTTSQHTVSSKMLQVPAVVIGAHPDKGNSTYQYGGGSVPKTSKPFLVVPSSSPGIVTKQRSQPEMLRSHSEGIPTMIKKQPSVFTHMPTTSDYPSSSCSQGNHPLLPSVAIQLPLIKKQSSSPGSLLSTSSHLRPIQPKPSSVGGDKEPPIIQFMTDEDQALPQSRFPRAISEEPAMSRNLELLSPGGHIPLTQSVSQDTGLDGGLALMNRIMSSSSQSLGVPKLTTAGGTTSSLASSPSTPSSSSVTHAPVLRDGPALGCNYCWNSQDTQGRVQRRKTKYHCPACRTNLCIVPCFHEYHSQMQMQQDQHKQFTKVLTKTSST